MCSTLQKDTDLQDANETFEMLEQLCDRANANFERNVFQYIHRNDQDQVLALPKRRARTEIAGELQGKILNSTRNNESCQHQLVRKSPLKNSDRTQLEYVEAPSGFWDIDSTIDDNDSALQADLSVYDCDQAISDSTFLICGTVGDVIILDDSRDKGGNTSNTSNNDNDIIVLDSDSDDCVEVSMDEGNASGVPSPSTPINNAAPQYSRNSRLLHQPYRRI
ncbi:hypothetical protein KR222_002515 [Zaprionus bogoriensis]|nr:hypothetical protein KR222_002515 [Zaprionus bogoriensis]